MIKEDSFDTGVVSINYAEGAPAGPPLVLLHGITDCWQDFLPVIPDLASRWHIYALDFRGHGRSGHAPGQYRLLDYAADVEAFLTSRTGEPAAIFGMSLGGMVAIMIAARRPELVRGVVVGDSPLDPEALHEILRKYHSYWKGWRDLAGSRLSIMEIVESLADMPVTTTGRSAPLRYGDTVDIVTLLGKAVRLSHLDPEVLTAWEKGSDDVGAFRTLSEGYDSTLLGAVSCPVLLLQGNPALGGIMTDREVERALAVLLNAYHVLIEDAGHNLGLDTWEVAPLLRALTGFLEPLRRAAD